VGGLDPGAIAQVQSEAWPDVRDEDELHDVLHTLVALPELAVSTQPSSIGLRDSRLRDQVSPDAGIPQRDFGPGVHLWERYFERLKNAGRAAVAVGAEAETASGRRRYWVAAERARSFQVLFPSTKFEAALANVETSEVPRDDALLILVQGWMSAIGPATPSQLGELLGLPASDIEKALLRMEAAGTVLRGNFTGSAHGPGAATTTAAEAAGCRQGAQSKRRSAFVLALHEYAHR